MIVSELTEARKRNLLRLVETRFSGNFTNLAKACGRSQSQISNVLRLNNSKNIGEKWARGIEIELGLPTGWLDSGADVPVTPGLSGEEDLFLLSVTRALRAKEIPSHVMQTVLLILSATPDKKTGA